MTPLVKKLAPPPPGLNLDFRTVRSNCSADVSVYSKIEVFRGSERYEGVSPF